MELFSLPAVYDTAFQFRNARKAVDFIEECVRTYAETPITRIIDIACGADTIRVSLPAGLMSPAWTLTGRCVSTPKESGV